MMSHRQMLAWPVLERFVLRHIDVNTPNVALLSHIIAESLFRRLDSTLIEGRNIYVQKFDIPQIEMFYKMAQAYPQIYASHQVANQYLADRLRDLREVTYFDIGVGRGVQLQDLVTRLMLDQTSRVERMKVVALDPDPQNLDDTRDQLAAMQSALPFDIDFVPLCTVFEQLEPEMLEQIGEEARGGLAINAAYALHHTEHPLGDQDFRTELLQRLGRMRPRIFTLIEPSSDHDTESLVRRFHNCWQHFGTVFELIDESGLSPSERFHVKETFFGREIRDMFGASDRFRCERHEPYETWMLRLEKAGFRPATGLRPEVALPSYCEHSAADGLVRLGYNGMTLIAVFAREAA